MKLCKCGCGQEVKPNRRFISGHNTRLRKRREILETPPQMFCLCGCGEITNYNKRFISGHNTRINNPTDRPEVRKKISENNAMHNPVYRKKISIAKKGKPSPLKGKTYEQIMGPEKADKRRKQTSNALKGRPNPKIRGNKNPAKRPDVGEKISKNNSMKNPYYRQKQLDGVHKRFRGEGDFCWKGTRFKWESEMYCAQAILRKPIYGINYQVKVNGHIIDFYPQSYDKQHQHKFVEYHPMVELWDGNKTKEEYQKERQQIIDNSKHKGTDLIVITDLNNINEEVK